MESLGIDLIDQNLRYSKGYLTKNDQLLKDEIFFESNGFVLVVKNSNDGDGCEADKHIADMLMKPRVH